MCDFKFTMFLITYSGQLIAFISCQKSVKHIDEA